MIAMMVIRLSTGKKVRIHEGGSFYLRPRKRTNSARVMSKGCLTLSEAPALLGYKELLTMDPSMDAWTRLLAGSIFLVGTVSGILK